MSTSRQLRQLWTLLRDPLEGLTRLAREEGPVASFRLGVRRAVLLSDPTLVDYVLRDRRCERSPETRRGFAALVGEGLLSLEGAAHLRHRRLMQPAFARERIERYGPLMVEAARTELAAWCGSRADLREDMMRLTLAIVGRALFSAEMQPHARQIDAILRRLLPALEREMLLSRVLPFGLPPRLSVDARRDRAALAELVLCMVEARRRAIAAPRDLLSMLLAARDDAGEPLSDEAVCAELLTILLAGHDTTAHTLTWCWFLLTAHPEIQRAVAREVDSVTAGRALQASDRPQLQLTARVVREALRLYPAVWWIDRVASEAFTHAGRTIEAGTLLVISPFVLHRDARNFADPERFDPDRFLPEAAAGIAAGAYLPFGAGAHACIGSSFALAEAALLLGVMAQQLRVHATSVASPRPLITLGMAEAFPVSVERRTSALPLVRQP